MARNVLFAHHVPWPAPWTLCAVHEERPGADFGGSGLLPGRFDSVWAILNIRLATNQPPHRAQAVWVRSYYGGVPTPHTWGVSRPSSLNCGIGAHLHFASLPATDASPPPGPSSGYITQLSDHDGWYPYHATYYPYHASYYPYHATYYPYHATHYPYHATYYPYHATYYAYHATYYPYHATYYPYHATYYAYHVTYYPYHATYDPLEQTELQTTHSWRPGQYPSPSAPPYPYVGYLIDINTQLREPVVDSTLIPFTWEEALAGGMRVSEVSGNVAKLAGPLRVTHAKFATQGANFTARASRSAAHRAKFTTQANPYLPGSVRASGMVGLDFNSPSSFEISIGKAQADPLPRPDAYPLA